MSLTECQLCAFVCQRRLFLFAAISASFCPPHLAACVALAAGAGATASGRAAPTPPSCSLITAVRQPCLGSSHSISHCCAVGAGTALPDPPCGNGRPQLSVILGTLLACADRGFLSLVCLHRAHNGLLQTAAILFVPVPLVCLPLLHSPNSRTQLPAPVFPLLFRCVQIPL